MKIKICGIKDKSTLDFCEKNKVDYYGLIFYKKSKRYINITDANKLIFFNRNYNIKSVGVFVDYELEKIIKTVNKLKLNYVQLHGKEDDQYILKLKKNTKAKIIKAIGVNQKKDLKKVSNIIHADYYLFDYKPKANDLPGGNAKSFDWSILKDVKIRKPWFISGGISIDNIVKVLKYLNPYGIDISSGVEDRPGIKSLSKIAGILKVFNDQR